MHWTEITHHIVIGKQSQYDKQCDKCTDCYQAEVDYFPIKQHLALRAFLHFVVEVKTTNIGRWVKITDLIQNAVSVNDNEGLLYVWCNENKNIL